jgi:hypothetical protein
MDVEVVGRLMEVRDVERLVKCCDVKCGVWDGGGVVKVKIRRERSNEREG